MSNETTRDQSTFEIVVFKLRDGATHDGLIEASIPVSVWVRQQPGFIDRKMIRSDDGDTYVEIVRWETHEEAVNAAGLAETSPQCAPMFALVGEEDMVFIHGSSVLEAYAGAAV